MIDVISFSVGASLVNLIPFYRFVLLHACCMVLAFLRVYDEQCGGGPTLFCCRFLVRSPLALGAVFGQGTLEDCVRLTVIEDNQILAGGPKFFLWGGIAVGYISGYMC